MQALFGSAGIPDSFYENGYKNGLDMPAYLRDMGLTAYEYQCGHGVNIRDERAAALGEKAREAGIALSLHAPYYISLASPDPEKRQKSIDYILRSAQAAKMMGARRVVVHPGALNKQAPGVALQLAKETLRQTLRTLHAQQFHEIRLCLETMGRVSYLGTLDEILELCLLDESFLPCIDFGHLNARTQGGLRAFSDFAAVFDRMENVLGIARMREFHAHFSKIEYTAAGERRHLTFADQTYGPDYEPVIELTLQKQASPTIICESAGTQAEDASTMLQYYRQKRVAL